MRATEMDRFWSKIRREPNGCWQWTAYIFWHGYGGFKVNRRHIYAHRFAYTRLVGPVPDGLELDHLCRNRACVNPDHLEPVDRRTNLARGETIVARALSRTHCPQGHAYDEANTVLRRTPGGGAGRGCRACHLEKCRRQRAIKRQLHGADVRLARKSAQTRAKARGTE